ncbi:hypothetical protein PRIPAC_80514 [Pristionchus pacificus]|uniref:Uncharacterized protein n=1 Tax=Pristionchus pacificus TaxID=54126 RepID=A0A2A6C3R6_PRIPA|nr:hypothetical protein PRIPAC_80514 [Pristionchus pacificus]|eukprot:PDM72814.1 hypothetical protein PRIPAC_39248 [Pristionchus pacificus]
MGRRANSMERENSTQDTQDTERTPSTTNLLGGDKHGKGKRESSPIMVYIRSTVYFCYAVLVFVLVWMPTLIKPRYTEKTEFRLGMVQSPSSYCSEFGRHLMLNYRFEMGVEEIAAGVQLCLRYAHPHQCRFRENLMLRSAPKSITDFGGNWETLVNSGPTANAITQDGLVHWFWRWTKNNETGDILIEFRFGLMLKEALEWWTLGHSKIPISPSLHKAINQKSSFLRHIRQTDYLIDSVRRLVKGDLFAFPNDIYPVKPDISTIDGQLLMRFRTSNISRMGFPDTKGVRRDFKMCKYSSLTESTADIIQIFMNTFAERMDYVGEHNFSPTYLKGLLKMEEAILAKWMSWNYVDPDRFQRIYDPSILNIQANDDPFMKENGYILAERGTESNSWKSLSGSGSGYGMGKFLFRWGSGTFHRNMAMNGFQKLLKQEFTRQAVLSPLHPFILPFQPLIISVDRGDAVVSEGIWERLGEWMIEFPYNMEVYGTVSSGRNILPLVEPIEILLAAAFGPWAVTDIDRAVAEGRIHLSWIKDEEYADLDEQGKLKKEGEETKGAVKLQYSKVIPATIREVVIKDVNNNEKLNVLRETIGFDEDERTIAFSWSNAVGIIASLAREKEEIYDGSLGGILNGSIFSAADGGFLLSPFPNRLNSFTPSAPVLYTGGSFVEPSRQDSVEETRITFFTVFSLETIVVLIICHLVFLSIGVATNKFRDKRLNSKAPEHLKGVARMNCLLFELTQVVYCLSLALVVYYHSAGFQGNNAIIESQKTITFSEAVKEMRSGMRTLLAATDDTYSKMQYEFLLGPNYSSDGLIVTDGLFNFLKILCDPPPGKKLMGIMFEGDRTAIAQIGKKCIYNQIPYTSVDGKHAGNLKELSSINPYFYLFAKNLTGKRKAIETVNQVVLRLFSREQIMNIWTIRYMSSVRSLYYTIEEKKTFTYAAIRMDEKFIYLGYSELTFPYFYVKYGQFTGVLAEIGGMIASFLKRDIAFKRYRYPDPSFESIGVYINSLAAIDFLIGVNGSHRIKTTGNLSEVARSLCFSNDLKFVGRLFDGDFLTALTMD